MDKLKKEITLIFIAAGSLLFILDIIGTIIWQKDSPSPLIDSSFIILSLCLSLLITGYFFFPKVLPFIQISLLLLNSFFSNLQDYTSFFGMGQIILAYLLIYHYGYIKSNTMRKTVLFCCYYLITIGISLYLTTQKELVIELLLFAFFFLHIFYLLYKSEIKTYADLTRDYSRDLTKLERKKTILKRQQLKIRKD